MKIDHLISYNFRGIRCRWRCSCNNIISKYHSSFLGAHRAAYEHLIKHNADITQDYKTWR